nr:MAG TPA: hypothetical protein [Caudoviricetes sp.]
MTLILIIYYMCEIAKWRSRYLITLKFKEEMSWH